MFVSRIQSRFQNSYTLEAAESSSVIGDNAILLFKVSYSVSSNKMLHNV